MNAYGSTSLFGMLMDASLVSGASALKINDQPAPATDGALAYTYPSFRYVTRLHYMQEAWRRARLSNVSDDAAVQSGGEAKTLVPEVLDAAQRTITRAEQANRAADQQTDEHQR